MDCLLLMTFSVYRTADQKIANEYAMRSGQGVKSGSRCEELGAAGIRSPHAIRPSQARPNAGVEPPRAPCVLTEARLSNARVEPTERHASPMDACMHSNETHTPKTWFTM